MTDQLDTDRFDVSGFDQTDGRRDVLALEDTAVFVLEQAVAGALDPELDDTDRIALPRARTQPEWPPVPPPPQARSRRHKAIYSVVARPKTSSDG
jgi:hypothetical protein